MCSKVKEILSLSSPALMKDTPTRTAKEGGGAGGWRKLGGAYQTTSEDFGNHNRVNSLTANRTPVRALRVRRGNKDAVGGGRIKGRGSVLGAPQTKHPQPHALHHSIVCCKKVCCKMYLFALLIFSLAVCGHLN